ncbi:MAG: hypothetical protein JST84_31790 [Acidobacteria bacterium]|nr:hypothetical protein [Acidobacteriota bacterium]
MQDARRQFLEALLATPALPLLAQAQDQFKPVVVRGRIVNLTDVMQAQAKLEPEHGTIYCLKTAEGKLYPILPTDLAAAIYDDERFRQRELQITGRTFPEIPFLEVIKLQSVKWGRVFDMTFYCRVCEIRTHKGGPCACCQDPLEFSEEPVKNN